MKQRWYGLILMTGLIFFFQSLAHAESNPLFGPEQYVRSSASPNSYSETFKACNTGATYNIIILNGHGGEDVISSANITLNGIKIVGENEFNQKVERIEKSVTLLTDNTLNVNLASGPEGVLTVSISCISGCLEIDIIFPATLSTINKSRTTIQGSLNNVYGETGVILANAGVDGPALAHLQAAEFAGTISLQQGANTITAIATDACGYMAQDTISINTDSLQDPLRVTVIPGSGVSSADTGTLSVTFEAEALIQSPVANYSWDFNGDGVPEAQGSDLNTVTHDYYVGLYMPKVTITDTLGSAYTETVVVNVLSREQMSALLSDKWNSMTGLLTGGDIGEATQYFVAASRNRYWQVFTDLGAGLETIFSDVTEFKLYTMYGRLAECGAIRLENGERYSYPVTFVQDQNGIWKILGL